MCNADIRSAAEKAHVPQWKIADALGINEFSFSRRLRHELPAEEKEAILRVIARLSEE